MLASSKSRAADIVIDPEVQGVSVSRHPEPNNAASIAAAPRRAEPHVLIGSSEALPGLLSRP